MPANKKKLFAVAAIAVLAIVSVWGYSRYAHDSEGLKLYGAIDQRTVDLAFEESGRLKSVEVVEGSAVKAGDVIALLDDTRYRIALEQAQSQVGVAQAELTLLLAGARTEEIEAAKARLAAAEATLLLSEKSCKRQKALGAASSDAARDEACYAERANRASRDEAQKVLDLLLAGTRAETLDIARANLRQSEAALADARRALNNCVLKAPSAGVVRSRLKEPGDMVGAASPIVEMALTDPLWARVYVDEINLGKVAMGQKVGVTCDSYPDKVFEATVGFISTVAEFTPKTVQTEAIRTGLVYEVRLTVADPEGLLRLGMPVTAELTELVAP